MYAAPVTSNVICWDAHQATWRREVFILFGAVLLKAVHASVLRCSFPLGELEPLHKVERWGSRFIMCGAVWLRAVWIVSHELFLHSERIRAVRLGVCIYRFLCHTPVLYCCHWNILLTRKWAVRRTASCIHNWEPYFVHLKYYQCDGATAIWMIKLSFEKYWTVWPERWAVHQTASDYFTAMEGESRSIPLG